MRRTHHLIAFASPLLVAVLALGACASAGPPIHLHSLMPSQLAPRSAAAAAEMVPIALEQVRLPAQVDQPQWLVQLADGSLASLEQDRWASPLRDELRQALLEELAVHAGAVEARGTAAGATPPMRIGIDIRRFDSLPGREARIEGSWTLQPGLSAGATTRCEWLYREAASAGMAELAAAHRRAVIRLADGIGDGLLALRRGAPPQCPPSDPR
ncbi:MAG: PqiC family protein [Caldimonas sp.]